jgi:hypothetical protein
MDIHSTPGPEEEWKLMTVCQHAHGELGHYERKVS